MVGLVKIAVQLLADVAGFAILLCRSTTSVQAENLFLRRELGLFKERGVQPCRPDAATRISLAFLATLFDWRGALLVVQPKTLIRWQRAHRSYGAGQSELGLRPNSRGTGEFEPQGGPRDGRQRAQPQWH